MRRPLAVPAVASVVVGLVAGCSPAPSPAPSTSVSTSASPVPPSPPSSPKQAADPLPDPAALLTESSAATKDLKSVHLVLSVSGQVAAMPVQSLEGDLTEEPSSAAQGDTKTTIVGAQVPVKFIEFGDRLYAALPDDRWRDYGPTSDAWDVTAMLNPKAGLAKMLTDFIDPEVETRETVGGQQTIRIAGNVTADAVNKILPLDATKRMPSTVWIQESGDRQLVQLKLEPDKSDSIEMTFANWNAPVVIRKPPGA